ncbi:winged helix-turn-helix domain-containing protein, partial [Yersinia ruckeri]
MTSISSKNTIRVDKENGILRSGDLIFSLSKNECLMLELLYENSDSVISIENIIKGSWLGKVVSPISVPVAIKHIRDILKKCIATQVIVTHKGVGYSFIKSEIKIIFSHVDNYTEKGNTLKTNFFSLLPMGHPKGLCILSFLFCTFILSIPEWGSTPEPQIFPSSQFQPANQRIQVNNLIVALEGVMPVQQNMLP